MKKQVEFKNSKTLLNLARSYASECMEGARYQFMAKKCETQNLEYVKTQLKTLAKHEMSHAKLFWDYITQYSEDIIDNIEISAGYPFECGTLAEDFKFSAENESELHDHIYPSFSKIAKDEGFLDIANAFKLVAEVEEYHSEILSNIYSKLKTNTLYKSPDAIIWTCSKCGNQNKAKSAPKTCPLCKLDQGYYEFPATNDN